MKDRNVVVFSRNLLTFVSQLKQRAKIVSKLLFVLEIKSVHNFAKIVRKFRLDTKFYFLLKDVWFRFPKTQSYLENSIFINGWPYFLFDCNSSWQLLYMATLTKLFKKYLWRRFYSSRLLPLQVLGTWIGGFASLLPTLASAWGQFGMDPEIGSCSILPDQ